MVLRLHGNDLGWDRIINLDLGRRPSHTKETVHDFRRKRKNTGNENHTSFTISSKTVSWCKLQRNLPQDTSHVALWNLVELVLEQCSHPCCA